MFNKKTPKSKTLKSRLHEKVPHLTPDPNFQLSDVSSPICFRPFLPPYDNQNAFYQSPTGLYRPTMDSSTSSHANQPYSPLNRVTIDMNFEQLINNQEYYQSQDYSMGQGSAHGSAYSSAHGSAVDDDDDSSVEEMSPVKA
ncbi:hypothetical protein Tco_0194205 [Tanacetum coccineum]